MHSYHRTNASSGTETEPDFIDDDDVIRSPQLALDRRLGQDDDGGDGDGVRDVTNSPRDRGMT